MNIAQAPNQRMRIQLSEVFRKYVHLMLKEKMQAEKICRDFGDGFRPIHIVQERFDTRPLPDEALCVVLWEYKTRGKKGYDFTDKFFDVIQGKFPDMYIGGPRGAGADIQATEIWSDYPNNSRPLDFIISSKKKIIYAAVLARYDGDRGGA